VIGQYIDELERGLNPDMPEREEESAVAEDGETSLLNGDLESRWNDARQTVDRGSRYLDGIRGMMDEGEEASRRTVDDAGAVLSDFQESLDGGAEKAGDALDRGRGALDRVGSKFDEWRSQSDDTFR